MRSSPRAISSKAASALTLPGSTTISQTVPIRNRERDAAESSGSSAAGAESEITEATASAAATIV